MNNKLKIVEKKNVFFIISAIIIIAGIILLIVPGLNLGLDFTEGASVQVYLNVPSSDKDSGYVADVEKYIEDSGFEVGNTRITSDGGNSVLQFDLRYRYNNAKVANDEFADLLGSEEEGLIGDVIKYINEGNVVTDDIDVDYVDKVTYTFTSPDATASLTRRAILAIAIAIVAMLIYIAIRFKLTSGIAAVIVLIHDVFVMLTLTAAFRITVNTTFIAAIITVIGYSINATIIVFDRIKENLKRYEGQGLSDTDVANISIKETMRRTIFTTITTLVMIVLIAILGVPTIRQFALPIIFGLLSGVYSAIILSSCVWVQIRKIAKKIVPEKKSGYSKYAKEKKTEAKA
ncbi:MAG: protein translocase subunit SecF [Clostridia bacterium]|nr:protein translocase subunit SecF [Clostridia bacterium]